MIRHLHTLAELESARAEAATMSAACPVCGRAGLKVREQIKQATRREPAILLCFQGWCPSCQLSVPADNCQLRL
jgi:hypothetical protein